MFGKKKDKLKKFAVTYHEKAHAEKGKKTIVIAETSATKAEQYCKKLNPGIVVDSVKVQK